MVKTGLGQSPQKWARPERSDSVFLEVHGSKVGSDKKLDMFEKKVGSDNPPDSLKK